MSRRNENRPAYKKPKDGWIHTDWDLVQFGRLITLSQYGLSVDSKLSGNTILLRMGNIENGKVTFNDLAFTYASPAQIKKYEIRINDLLFNRTNSLNHVGKLGIVKEYKSAVFASYLVRFRVDETKALPGFIAYFFCTNNSRRKLNKLATPGVCQFNINQSDLQKHFFVSLPPLPEQEKITEILSTWDNAIEQTRKLIEAKKRRKKALMQQLLAGYKRFPEFKHESWAVVPLRNFITPVLRPVPKPNQPYLAIGIRSHGKGTFHKIVEEPDKVQMETLYVLEENDIVLNITFAWEGAVAIADSSDSGGLVSHRFPTYRVRKEADLSFFRQIIMSRRFIWDLGLISPGGAGRNRVLDKKDFLNLKIRAPSKKVQEYIGTVLSAADLEIYCFEKQLAALEKQKRGLMQKLLTGEVRVKT